MAHQTQNLSMIDRLKQRMDELNINARELAERAEVGGSFVYDVLSGKSANPTISKLASVAEVLGVSVNYLLLGTPDLPLARSISEELRPLSVFGFEDSSRKDKNRIGFDRINPQGRPKDVVSIASINVEASMGGGSFVEGEEEAKSYYFRRSWIRDQLHATPGELRIISVRGDSMHPTLAEGDVVLVNIARRAPTPPGIFVLYDGIGLVVKRLEYISSGPNPSVRIISDNQQYPPYERSAMEIHVIGRVVWFAREL